MKTIKDYTHKGTLITDIRLKKGKNNKDDFFAIHIDAPGIDVLFVNYHIFNDRVKSYFLGKSVNEISRSELLALRWNFIITESYYLKIIAKDHFEKIPAQPGKQFISILEIAGSISNFANNFADEVQIFDDKSYELGYGVLGADEQRDGLKL